MSEQPSKCTLDIHVNLKPEFYSKQAIGHVIYLSGYGLKHLLTLWRKNGDEQTFFY